MPDLMPTPRAGDGEEGGPNQRGSSGDLMLPSMKAAHNNGNGHGVSLNIEAQRVMDLLPTPVGGSNAANADNRKTPGYDNGGENYFEIIEQNRWGKYSAAIARWERVTRPAPEPTNITAGYIKARLKRLARLDKRPIGMRGSLKPRRKLAAVFSEWMMGVPLGWITDTPGITRNEALKAAGNGVVPQQAAEALRFLLDMPTGRQIADAHEPDDLFELLGQMEAAS